MAYDSYLNEGWPSEQMMGIDLLDILEKAGKEALDSAKDKALSEIAQSKEVQQAVSSQSQKAAASSLSSWLLENKKMVLIISGGIAAVILVGIIRR